MIIALDVSDPDATRLILSCRQSEIEIERHISRSTEIIDYIRNHKEDPTDRKLKTDQLSEWSIRLGELMAEQGSNLQKLGVVVMNSTTILTEGDILLMHLAATQRSAMDEN